MDDPYCAANRPLGAESCLPEAVECKFEISLRSPVALQAILIE